MQIGNGEGKEEKKRGEREEKKGEKIIIINKLKKRFSGSSPDWSIT